MATDLCPVPITTGPDKGRICAHEPRLKMHQRRQGLIVDQFCHGHYAAAAVDVRLGKRQWSPMEDLPKLKSGGE